MDAIDAERLGASRISRAERMARQLEQQIVDSGLPAGERLGTKSDLRRQFGVAVATVNEALRLLETRGLVEARPGPRGGVFVAAPASRVRLRHLVLGFKIGDAPFSDCLAVRNELEPLVCREASRYCNAGHARALRKIVERMEREVDRPAEFLKLNWELHRQLARMCRNVALKGLYLTLLDYVQEGIAEVRGDERFDGRQNHKIHKRLVEAIVARDMSRLERAIDEHTPMAARWADDAFLP